MSESNSERLNELEWESFKFPLILNNITFQYGLYNFDESTQIKIWRDDQYNLTAEIEGIADNQFDLIYDYREILHRGEKPLFENFMGKNDKNEIFKLRDCHIENFSHKPFQNQIKFKANLSLRRIAHIKANTDQSTIIDWHICSFKKLFPRVTLRSNHFPYKFRTGINDPSQEQSKKLISFIRDFLIIKTDEYSIIVQKVDEEFLPKWADGISIEYRKEITKIPSPEDRRKIAEFVSFVLGNHLLLTGTSYYNDKGKLDECAGYSPEGNNVIDNCKSMTFPPISRLIIDEKELGSLLSKYLEIRDKYDLRDVLWKLWNGRMQPLGTNLPILASGLDTLVSNYVKKNNLITKYSKSEKRKFRNEIKEEFENLEKKLENYQFGDFVLNKLRNPFHFGIGEKIKIFLDDLNFKFNKESIESKALQARNEMAHGSMTNLSDEEKLKYSAYTRAYITLYNRIILKLLAYDKKYVDYYNLDFPKREIDQNIKMN